jgi:hypothetical protein
MQFIVGVLILLMRGVLASSTDTSGAGLAKVVEMLEEMTSVAKTEKQEEQVAFAKFSTWCTEESASLKNEIADNTEEIEGLTASSDKLKSDAAVLADEIAKLQADVEKYETEKKAKEDQREKDHNEFLAVSQDHSESIDALDRALVRLQNESYDRPAAAAVLTQLSSSRASLERTSDAAVSFLKFLERNRQPAGLEYEEPKANAYEFQSGGIVDILKNLKDEFRTKLADTQKEEMKGKHAHAMIVQDLVDSTSAAKKDISEKTKGKESKLAAAAADDKEKAGTETVKAGNEKTLAEMTAECTEKSESYKEKQQLRAEEIEAMANAIEILKSPEVANAPSFAAVRARGGSTALVQSRTSGIRRDVRKLLERDGQRLHSQRLSLLAAQIAADPFAKVKSMIDAMLKRLLEEANTDADHEGFCDTEMGKSKLTRAKLSEDIEMLTAELDEGKSKILTLTQDIAALEKESADLQTALAEAGDMRADDKAKNAATVKEAKEAQAAVSKAIAVLKDFYAKALTATGFLQLPTMGSDEWNSLANPAFKGKIDKGHKEGMQTFGETYKGQQDQAGGVLALLEVILADFATLEADTTAAEEAGAKSYKEFKVTSERNLATQKKQVEMNTADKTKAEAKLESDTQDLKATQDQLLAAERYHEELVPQCIDKGMTFEERTKAREAEITSLKEALKILSSEDVETSAL